MSQNRSTSKQWLQCFYCVARRPYQRLWPSAPPPRVGRRRSSHAALRVLIRSGCRLRFRFAILLPRIASGAEPMQCRRRTSRRPTLDAAVQSRAPQPPPPHPHRCSTASTSIGPSPGRNRSRRRRPPLELRRSFAFTHRRTPSRPPPLKSSHGELGRALLILPDPLPTRIRGYCRRSAAAPPRTRYAPPAHAAGPPCAGPCAIAARPTAAWPP